MNMYVYKNVFNEYIHIKTLYLTTKHYFYVKIFEQSFNTNMNMYIHVYDTWSKLDRRNKQHNK